jgi:hypothetical protein
LIPLSKVLSILVVVLAVLAVSVIAYTQILLVRNSYNSKIEVSFSKSPVAYDYSCSSNDYQISFVIKNTGSKSVVGLSVSITNPDCNGGVPSLPPILNASSTISFDAQTTTENGTLSISGNNTFVQIRF